MSEVLLTSLIGGGVTLFACVLLYFTRQYHGWLTTDWASGVQKIHSTPTTRVGGMPIFIGGIAGAITLSGDASFLWWCILLSTLPAFIGGILEDISNNVSARIRLLGTLFSGLCFALVTGYHLKGLGIYGADWLLGFPIFAACFTAFAIGGIANAINIIDGVHGLAAGTALIALAAFAYVAWQAGDTELLKLIALSFALTGAFFLFNFPQGLLFLGDAGAYFIGTVLAAFAVALPARNPEVAPLIGLVAFGYPVAETLYSMIRRKLRKGGKMSKADGRHLHSLLFNFILSRSDNNEALANPLTTLLLLPLPIICAAFAIIGNQNNSFIITALITIAWSYLALYRIAERRNLCKNVLRTKRNRQLTEDAQPAVT